MIEWKLMYLTHASDMCGIKGYFNVDIEVYRGTYEECQAEDKRLLEVYPDKTFSIKGVQ